MYKLQIYKILFESLKVIKQKNVDEYPLSLTPYNISLNNHFLADIEKRDKLVRFLN